MVKNMTDGNASFKPMLAFAVASIGPIYLGFILSFIITEYATLLILGGLVCAAISLLALMLWSSICYQGWAVIGLTLQHADGLDEYCNIIYKNAPRDLGKDGAYYRYNIAAVDGVEWIIMLDHPLEEILPRFERVPIGMFMPTVATRFVTGVLLEDTEVMLHKDDIKPSLLQRFSKQQLPNSRLVRSVYVYGTPAAVKRLKSANGAMPQLAVPDNKSVKALYGAWFDTTYADMKARLNSVEEDLRSTMAMLDNRLPITLRVRNAVVEEENAKGALKWIVLAIALAAGIFILIWSIGVL